MELVQMINAVCEHTETESLKREVTQLKQTLARMSEATIGISENLATEAVLQEVVNSV